MKKIIMAAIIICAACNSKPHQLPVCTEYDLQCEREKDYQLFFLDSAEASKGVDAFGIPLKRDWYIYSSKAKALIRLKSGDISFNSSRLYKFTEGKCDWREVCPGSSATPKVAKTKLILKQDEGMVIPATLLLFGSHQIAIDKTGSFAEAFMR